MLATDLAKFGRKLFSAYPMHTSYASRSNKSRKQSHPANVKYPQWACHGAGSLAMESSCHTGRAHGMNGITRGGGLRRLFPATDLNLSESTPKR